MQHNEEGCLYTNIYIEEEVTQIRGIFLAISNILVGLDISNS